MKYPPHNIDQSCFDWVKIILKKTELPPNAKYLALYLATYMNLNRDFAYPGLKTIERETGLSHATVLKHLDLLVGEGWIGKQSGSRTESNRYWITFPDDLGQSLTYVNSGEKVGQPLTSNNNRITNNKYKRFTPPTVEEVREYCQERGNNIDPEYFVDQNTQKGWVVGKNRTPMKDWKAAIRTWEKFNGKSNGNQSTTQAQRKLSGAERTRLAREQQRLREQGADSY